MTTDALASAGMRDRLVRLRNALEARVIDAEPRDLPEPDADPSPGERLYRG